jgi:hypothetical protein
VNPTAQRTIGIVVLLGAGMLSLPVAASLLDGRSTENWIVPAQLVVMGLVGAAVTIALPALARAGASTGRRALTGAWWGLLAAFVGVLIFWFLINGIGGA